MHQPEAFLIAQRPFVIVQKRPSHIARQRHPLGNRAAAGLQVAGEIGDPVKSTATGVVNFAGVQNGYGNIVRISLQSGYEIMFAHLSAIDVKNGQTVNAGDIIGKVGSTGRSTGPHLHYEIRKDGTPIDPEQFLVVSAQ